MPCYRKETFADYFNENMESMSMLYPKHLFSTAVVATGTARAILTPLSTLGKQTLVSEIIVAGTILEGLSVVAGMLAVGYVGVVIGSIVVATGRVAGCGATIQDAFVYLNINDMYFPEMNVILNTYPGILDPSVDGRIAYSSMMTA